MPRRRLRNYEFRIPSPTLYKDRGGPAQLGIRDWAGLKEHGDDRNLGCPPICRGLNLKPPQRSLRYGPAYGQYGSGLLFYSDVKSFSFRLSRGVWAVVGNVSRWLRRAEASRPGGG